ncbi:SRPBCC family protein [Streptomyces albidoflavus]|uniref:SRPBCC family protein n=1 Tax=Streptomyces albidoflavus TaxID=1886 RepID=UPI00344239EF
MTRFELETRIAAPVPLVFGLSLDVDAHTASMARSGERAVTSGAMALGDTVTWRARHFGVVWRMTSRITAYDHPTHFVDEQTAGPFHHWWHAHHFTPDGHGGTLMRDEITFQAPLGPLGRLAERAALDRYMPHLMRERNAHLRAVAEREAGGAPGAGWVEDDLARVRLRGSALGGRHPGRNPRGGRGDGAGRPRLPGVGRPQGPR